jgi:hypothetical protein
MSQLHRKCGDRIIRIGLHRGITEQSDVKATKPFLLGYNSHWLQEPTSQNPFYTLSSEEIFENAVPIPFALDFIYFINGTFRDASRCKFLTVKLSFD